MVSAMACKVTRCWLSRTKVGTAEYWMKILREFRLCQVDEMKCGEPLLQCRQFIDQFFFALADCVHKLSQKAGAESAGYIANDQGNKDQWCWLGLVPKPCHHFKRLKLFIKICMVDFRYVPGHTFDSKKRTIRTAVAAIIMAAPRKSVGFCRSGAVAVFRHKNRKAPIVRRAYDKAFAVTFRINSR